MSRRASVLVATLATVVGACADSTPPWRSVLECGPPESDPTFCCDPATYRPIDATYLATYPTSQLGERLALRGSAAEQLALGGDSNCVCVGDLCSCIADLTVETRGCDGVLVPVPIGGEYGGRAVGCSDLDCWPLTLGMSYAVCGRWERNPTSNVPPQDPTSFYWLAIESFCVGE